MQIITMQAIHYLTLCLVVPPILTVFADPVALAYEGQCASYLICILLNRGN